MDQSVELRSANRDQAVERLSDFIVASIDRAPQFETPFYHLQFEHFFPEDVYAAMLAAMPVAADYRPLSGQNRCNVLPDGSLPKRAQMKFAPNTGYAFAVGQDTWHSADPVGHEVTTRDSILHTYFVDAGVLRFLRNRGKRVGNFLHNEVRSWSLR